MKKLIWYMVALLLVVVVACGDNKPSDVFKASLEAANEGNYEKVKQYQSADVLKLLESERAIALGGVKATSDEITKGGTIEKIEILEEKIRGEGAIVKAKITFKDGSVSNFQQPMIKEDGDWKVAM